MSSKCLRFLNLVKKNLISVVTVGDICHPMYQPGGQFLDVLPCLDCLHCRLARCWWNWIKSADFWWGPSGTWIDFTASQRAKVQPSRFNNHLSSLASAAEERVLKKDENKKDEAVSWAWKTAKIIISIYQLFCFHYCSINRNNMERYQESRFL